MSASEHPQTAGVVLFRSAQGAIGAERLLLEKGIAHKLVPVPRHLSSSCGFCIRFAWDDREHVTRLLSSAGLGATAIVSL